MVKITYMSHKGDEPLQVTVQEAKEIIEKEQANGKLVTNLDENSIVSKATMGHITDNTKVGVFDAVAGG